MPLRGTKFMSLSVCPSVLEISDSFKGILLDAYGVFWGGNDVGVLPGSKELMEHLVKSGKIVGILSNTTVLALKEKEKLEKHGLIEGKHFHFLVTSGEVARDLLLNEKLPFKTSKKKYWPIFATHPKFSSEKAIFKDTPYLETQDIRLADFIYISIPHLEGADQTNPHLFEERVFKLKDANIPMMCVNPDRFAHEGNPPQAVVRQGSIAAMYEELGGKVFYIGKPSTLAYKAALKYFCQSHIFHPEEVLMIGDTPETDIRGAISFGMSAALVTQTGIVADRICQHGLEAVIQNLPKQDFPNFFIERLA